MTTNPATAPTTADEMLAASARRAADYRPVILNPTPPRALPPRTRRHSVSHRAYR
jgi:hypothetical protein